MNQSSSDRTYLCPTCKTLEPVVIPSSETRRIVLASSMLYGVCYGQVVIFKECLVSTLLPGTQALNFP